MSGREKRDERESFLAKCETHDTHTSLDLPLFTGHSLSTTLMGACTGERRERGK